MFKSDWIASSGQVMSWARTFVLVTIGSAACLPIAGRLEAGATDRSDVQAERAPRPAAAQVQDVEDGRGAEADREGAAGPTPDSAAPGRGARPRAVASFEGTAAPGLRIWLSAADSTGEGLQYRWVQTKGPAVELARPQAKRVPVLIPGDATELEFLLFVSNAAGSDHKTLAVPLELHAKPTLPTGVMADAGDDQTAVVGHQVTLNGIRSTPKGRAAYRWIQKSGPKIRSDVEEAWIYAFTPEEAGLYRFVLVVAADGVISEPAEVLVLVAAAAPPELRAEASPSDPIEALAREALASVGWESRQVTGLADAFEGVAERMDLYRCYANVFSEISRRLDGLLPIDDQERADWDRKLIDPLADRIVAILKAEGLDLGQPRAEMSPLSEGQKLRLATLFRATARGFRGVAESQATPESLTRVGAGRHPSPR